MTPQTQTKPKRNKRGRPSASQRPIVDELRIIAFAKDMAQDLGVVFNADLIADALAKKGLSVDAKTIARWMSAKYKPADSKIKAINQCLHSETIWFNKDHKHPENRFLGALDLWALPVLTPTNAEPFESIFKSIKSAWLPESLIDWNGTYHGHYINALQNFAPLWITELIQNDQPTTILKCMLYLSETIADDPIALEDLAYDLGAFLILFRLQREAIPLLGVYNNHSDALFVLTLYNWFFNRDESYRSNPKISQPLKYFLKVEQVAR